MWEGHYLDLLGQGEAYLAKASASGNPSRPVYLKDPTSSHSGQALFEVKIGDFIASAVLSPRRDRIAVSVYSVIGITPAEVDEDGEADDQCHNFMAQLASAYFVLINCSTSGVADYPDLSKHPQEKQLQRLVTAVIKGLLHIEDSRSVYAAGISSGVTKVPLEYQDYQAKIASMFRNLLREPVRFALSDGQVVELPGESARFVSHPATTTDLPVIPGLTLKLNSFPKHSYDLKAYPEDGTMYIVPPIVAAVSQRPDFYVVDISKFTAGAENSVRSLRRYS
jgi:hypothetical protein